MKNKDMDIYNAGLYKALEIAKSEGIEALEKECKHRGLNKLNTKLSSKEYQKLVTQVSERVVGYYSASVLMILHDKFGFGKTRAKRFHYYFEDLADSIIRDYLTLDDVQGYIKEELGITLK